MLRAWGLECFLELWGGFGGFGVHLRFGGLWGSFGDMGGLWGSFGGGAFGGALGTTQAHKKPGNEAYTATARARWRPWH